MNMELKGKVAIVTGAGRGIGRAIAESLASNGCNVVLAARTESQLKESERRIVSSGGKAVGIAVDISMKSGIEKLIDTAKREFGTVDILINNAAVLYNTGFLDVTEAEWDQVMNINLKAVFMLSQAALRIMKEKRAGYIINISSTAALQVPAGLTTYGTSKKAIVGLSEALYETAKEFGVKVSVLYPGMTDTEMLRGFNPPVEPNRWMLPEDIVGCILFLLGQSDRVVVRDIVPWAARYDKI